MFLWFIGWRGKEREANFRLVAVSLFIIVSSLCFFSDRKPTQRGVECTLRPRDAHHQRLDPSVLISSLVFFSLSLSLKSLAFSLHYSTWLICIIVAVEACFSTLCPTCFVHPTLLVRPHCIIMNGRVKQALSGLMYQLFVHSPIHYTYSVG